MWLAIDAVKKGEADVAVSAGNTGALMAMARFNLKMKEGIERPAIAALWPTLKGESVVLDVGAAIGADEMHLVNLAAMGGAMARVLFDLDRVHPSMDGSMRIDFHQDFTEQQLAGFPQRQLSFAVDRQKVVRLFGSLKKLPESQP